MTIAQSFETSRRHGLAFPEASEDFPWGHTALKVRGKTFVWLNAGEAALSMTVKLPVSRDSPRASTGPSPPATALAAPAGSPPGSGRMTSSSSTF
ncbi:MmcQ/YjbR family DNA-binding protein [Allosphingosinicella sp.]|uniref:MmcQ/YjbR family DNA-binding protein n=1 Tax=Allosphingosinicella sp. TaxID=2823234 RepID=UPI003D748E82